MTTITVNLPDQCSNYYELLGLTPFESDRQTIDEKVRSAMREARKYQIGQFASQAQRHLDLLAEAMTCLLDAEQKGKYDDDLRRQFGLPPVAVASTYSDVTQPAVSPVFSDKRGFRSSLLTKWAVAATAATLLLAAILVAATRRPDVTDPVAKTNAVAPDVSNSPAPTPTTVPSSESPRPDSTPLVAQTHENANHPAASAQNTTRTDLTSTIPAANHPEPANPFKPAFDNPATGGAGTSSVPIDKPRSGKPPVTAMNPDPSPSAGSSKTSKSSGTSAFVPFQPPTEPIKSAAQPSRPPADSDLSLSTAEVLKELKALRVASAKLSSANSTAPQRALRLVRYGQSEYADDKRFQRQLDQEIAALKRVFPQLRNSLKDD